MAPNASVFVAEDDSRWLELIREKLKESGHRVVGEAATRNEALQKISTFREIGANVVVLGGNLGGGVFNGDSPHNDSVVILEALKNAGYEDLPTVGLSGVELHGVTVDLGKGNAGQLGEIVTGLLAFKHKEM